MSQGSRGAREGSSAVLPAPPVRSEIVLAFAIAGAAIVLASSLTTKVYRVPLTAQLGLYQLLPATYWLGLGMVGLSTFLAVRNRTNGLVATTGAILLAILAGTPDLFQPVPRYWDAFMHFAESQKVAGSGRLPADPFTYSANWPGAFIVIHTLYRATGVPALEFLRFFPFLSGGITFLAIFELLRQTFREGPARTASVPTALFAVWAQYHVSPQAIGFVLFLLVLATCRKRESKWRVVAAALFVSLVVSHPTSSILLLSILGVNAVLASLPWFHTQAPKDEVRREARFAQRLAITFAAVWLSWLFFLAVGSSEAARVAIVTRMDTILRLPEATVNVATARTSENLLTWAPLIRFGSMGVYGLLSLGSLAALFRNRASRTQFRLVFSAILGPGLVALADIFAFGGQFYDRSLLMFATFAPALCVTGLSGVRIPKGAGRAVLAVLVGASLATASTAYYVEAFNLVPEEAVAASDFVYTVPEGSIVIDGKFPEAVWKDPGGPPPPLRFTFAQIFPTNLENLTPGTPVYVVFDPTTELWHRQWYGTVLYEMYSSDRSDFSCIYDNGWTEVYAVHD